MLVHYYNFHGQLEFPRVNKLNFTILNSKLSVHQLSITFKSQSENLYPRKRLERLKNKQDTALNLTQQYSTTMKTLGVFCIIKFLAQVDIQVILLHCKILL